MLFGLVISFIFANLIFQLYITYLSLQDISVLINLYILDKQMAQSIAAGGSLFIKLFPAAVMIPLFFINLLGTIWIVQKKREGFTLYLFLALSWTIVGFFAYLSFKSKGFLWIEGIRGLVLMLVLLIYNYASTRKRYLFQVKK